MNLWGKAIISGIAIEGILLALMFLVPWGSCKPEGLSLILILLHYPALFFESHLPMGIGLPATFVLCSAMWGLLIYGTLRTMKCLKK